VLSFFSNTRQKYIDILKWVQEFFSEPPGCQCVSSPHALGAPAGSAADRELNTCSATVTWSSIGFTAAEMIDFCTRLLGSVDQKVLLIVDRHPAHRANKFHRCRMSGLRLSGQTIFVHGFQFTRWRAYPIELTTHGDTGAKVKPLSADEGAARLELELELVCPLSARAEFSG
jgi:hypothetical protein